MARCPRCESDKNYSPQGLHGHLRMGHSLSGEELERTYRKGLDAEPSPATSERLEAERAEEERAPKPRRRDPERKKRERPEERRSREQRGREEEQRRRPNERRDEREQRAHDRQPKRRGEERRRAPETDRLRRQMRPSTVRDARERVLDALDRLRRAKHRRKVAKEETDVPQSAMDRFLYGTSKGDDVGICEQCETEVEEAREEYQEAVSRLRELQQEAEEDRKKKDPSGEARRA